jgi:predicted ATPase
LFRRLQEITLNEIKRINIIAGIGNTGKTTVLEATKMLCSLNASSDFLALVRRRAKTSSEEVNMEWFLEQLPTADLAASFNGREVRLKLDIEQQSLDDMTQYLSSACFDVSFADKHWSSLIHFFDKYPQRTEGEFASICPSVFSSPFSGLEPELLQDCHSKSLKVGSKEQVIEFIRQYVDPHINNIEYNDNEHFTVLHDRIQPNLDLTKFGEGLQRIFKIGLLFAGAKNGVVIIDEFENAIHASLLKKVVVLLYDLAVLFNVQVFISSHSKECIDAFALCDEIPQSELSAYSLMDNDGVLKCLHFSGERLHDLIESIDFDLRSRGVQ